MQREETQNNVGCERVVSFSQNAMIPSMAEGNEKGTKKLFKLFFYVISVLLIFIFITEMEVKKRTQI